MANQISDQTLTQRRYFSVLFALAHHLDELAELACTCTRVVGKGMHPLRTHTPLLFEATGSSFMQPSSLSFPALS